MINMSIPILIIILITTVVITFFITAKILKAIMAKPVYSIIEFVGIPESDLKRYTIQKHKILDEVTYYRNMGRSGRSWVPTDSSPETFLGTLDQCKTIMKKTKTKTILKLDNKEYDLD